jgi:hypothetical protein
MNQKNKDRAKQIFEKSDFDTLYMNKKGNFFSSKNLALNSVKDTKEEKDRKIEKVSRADALKGTKPPAGNAKNGANNTGSQSKKKLLVTAADESKICFVDLTEGDTPKVGDKAKIGNKNAEGTIKMTPQISYKFDKGVLSEIIENKA